METQERILDALLVVKLLQKHVIYVNSQKSFTGLRMYLEVMHRLHLLFFSFLGAGLLMSFPGYSCPSIMIICSQPQT